MCGRRHGGDGVGEHTGGRSSATLPDHLTVVSTSTAWPPERVRRSTNPCLMQEGTTPVVLVHSPHQRSWWRRILRLIPPTSSAANPTRLSGLLLVALASTPVLLLVPGVSILLPLLLLPGAPMLPLLLLSGSSMLLPMPLLPGTPILRLLLLLLWSRMGMLPLLLRPGAPKYARH